MNKSIAKYAFAATLGLSLTGCKLAVIVGEGGDVESLSGNNDCAGSSYCIIDVTDTSFSETFTAIPRPGYEFVKWQDGTGFQCANMTSTVCTVAVPSGDVGIGTVASFETASIRPIFDNVGIDTDGDGIRNSIDDDDDNDGVLDVDDLDPLDPNVTTTCGATPDNVTLLADVDWASTGSQTVISLGQGDIKSTKFNATANPDYLGQVSIASTTGNSGVQRKIWISQCPGGETLPDPKCENFGTSSTVLRWTQGDPVTSRCNLTPLQQYYINYQNVNCPVSSCDVYRNLYHNGNP